jgi:hypothetical protein
MLKSQVIKENASVSSEVLSLWNAAQSAEVQLTFQRNISPPSSGYKNRPSKKPTCGRQNSFLALPSTLKI